jgi:uncharacterized protein
MSDQSPPPCPICDKPMQAAFRPFCSKRCADIDLNKWLTGSYVLFDPSVEAPSSEDPDLSDEDTSGPPDEGTSSL